MLPTYLCEMKNYFEPKIGFFVSKEGTKIFEIAFTIEELLKEIVKGFILWKFFG